MKQVFTCPHCKKAPKNGQWSRNWKWKTERGFKNHTCWKDIEAGMKKRELEIAKEKRVALEKAIAESEYKVGDKVHYWHYSITKPTHVQRGSRMVKVRYEEERSYWNNYGPIEKIQIGGYTIGGRFIPKSNICKTQEEAFEKAHEHDTSYKQACDFASFCR